MERVTTFIADGGDSSLPVMAWDSVIESFSNNTARKRVRLSPPISSDPAIFSSDDDPSAENYIYGRRKRQYRGPWYRQQPTSDSASEDLQGHENPRKSTRTLERRLDSGVWLGSDGIDVDDPTEGFESSNGFQNPPLPCNVTQKAQNGSTSPEELARCQIELCLDSGNESIDLTSRRLKTLSNETVRPLAAFARVPPITQGVFSHLEPRLKIFLASNELRTLPEELFKLDRLTVLSLRGNRIHELPPGIGNLQNLTELNISQNLLRYLPFEILYLFSNTSKLRSLQIHPNPFHEPCYSVLQKSNQNVRQELNYRIGVEYRRTRTRRGVGCCVSTELPIRSWHPCWKVQYKSRTEIRYIDINGSHLKGPLFSSRFLIESPTSGNCIPIADVGDSPKPPTPRGNRLSRVPSLLEVALMASTQTTQLPNLPSLLPESSPHHLSILLSQAAAKTASGGSKCTICERPFIIPRTEWVEWWEISKVQENQGVSSVAIPSKQTENERDLVEKTLPLMRRGCSWLCVPQQAAVRERCGLSATG